MLTSNEMMARIALMKHALVDTNVRSVPPEVLLRWLDYVTGRREHEPCVLCGDRQLSDCRWACVFGGEADGL